MNQEEMLNNNVSSGTYRATTNLNTAMENPQMNVGNAMGVNLDNVSTDFTTVSNNLNNNPLYNTTNLNQQESNSSLDDVGMQNVSTSVTNSFIPENVAPEVVNNYSNQETTVNYEPVMENSKKNDNGFAIPKELKIMAFIVLLLFIFVLMMPYIYDFLKRLELIIAG